jgi:sterol 3beta-glucosyltransferase
MRIALQTLGTRGDVQPYVALGLELVRRGHQVQIAAPVQFETFVRSRSLGFVGLPGEFLALIDSPEGKAAIAGGRGFSAGLKLLKHVRPLMRQLLDVEWLGLKAFEPDVIVHHPKSIASPHIATALGTPRILASPLPGFTPTAAFPSPLLPFTSLGPLNRWSHVLAIKGADILFSKLIREWRETSLGLGSDAGVRREAGTLYAYSPHVLPVPPDWGNEVLVSGYWFLDEPWQAPHDLSAFLAAGEAPVYIGFGSMPGLDPKGMSAAVVNALRQTGKRGLLAIGGGALAAGATPSTIKVIDAAPHDKLFPLVGAIIHHGGAGTTGAALRAGKPTAICPFFGDQPFWAHRVNALGVGPAAIDRKRISADTLSDAILAMDDPRMRARAALLGDNIRQEDGVVAAAAFIEQRANPRGGDNAPLPAVRMGRTTESSRYRPTRSAD